MYLKKDRGTEKGKIFPFGVILLSDKMVKHVKNQGDKLYFFSEKLLKYKNHDYTFSINSIDQGIDIFKNTMFVEFISQKDLKHVDVLKVQVFDPGYLLTTGNLEDGFINNGRLNIFWSKCLIDFESNGNINAKDDSAFLKVDKSLLGKEFFKLEFYNHKTKKDFNTFKVFSEDGKEISFEIKFPFKIKKPHLQH